MKIFNFIKKIFKKSEKIEETKEKITFYEIKDFIEKKIKETNTKEEEAISLIKDKITSFTGELREKIKIVNEVDIESKEKNDKVKSIVYEGRKKYVEFLERFIYALENAEGKDEKNKTNLGKIIEDINSAFTRFNENSGKSYERATILIGKEMGNTRESLKNLSKELITIFSENKNIILISKRLFLMDAKMNEIKDIKENLLKIDEEIASINDKIIKKKKENEKISEEIKSIKESAEYIKNVEKEKSIILEEKEIEEEMLNLKQLIDFKALSNFFHIFEDKMAIVKLYRDDFLKEFRKSGDGPLLNLLNESKLNTAKISEAIKQIQKRAQEIEKTKSTVKKDETKILIFNMEKINEEINNMEKEEKWKEKKNEEQKINQDRILKLIEDELNLMDIELEKN